MAVDSGRIPAPQHGPLKQQNIHSNKHLQTHHHPKDMSHEIAIKSAREVTRRPMEITNQPREISNLDIRYYPKKTGLADRVDRSPRQTENHNQAQQTKVTEYTSNDIQVTSHKLEPIHLRPPLPKKDSIQVTSHKTPHKVPSNQNDSPSQRLLRRKQEVTTKPPEVYLLDLDEVKVHKVKRIFKIGSKNEDEGSRRCHSEERVRRRTWHPTDTDRSTRSDGDVVTGRATRNADDLSPLEQERSSRSRQRRSAFMESIHSFFGSRKSNPSPSKHSSSSPPKSPLTQILQAEKVERDNHQHVARAASGKAQQAQYNRVRHLAEESNPTSPQRPKSWDKSALMSSPLGDAYRTSVQMKSSSLPPNQLPPGAEFSDDKNHVIYGMGEKTFKRFSQYLSVYDEPPESRV